MELRFFKYHGAGNDFVIVDGREEEISVTDQQVAFLCNRRFGIGADGLMILQSSEDYDFKMVYYNADGHQSTMCGNGGRCLIAFANHIGIIDRETIFEAMDGLHEGSVLEYGIESVIRLRMSDLGKVVPNAQSIFLDTGSPHHIELVEDVQKVDVFTEGKKWRHHQQYNDIGGCNVNFVQVLGANELFVRTFERGVEDETYSCGTGVTAAAVSLHALKKLEASSIDVQSKGGKLNVSFSENDGVYTDVYLEGPAAFVFQGVIDI